VQDPNQQKVLDGLGAELELCENDLADFLEGKRRMFPRFYFLATYYLLDILSNGNHPWIVVKHINNILQGVKTVKLEGEPTNTVVGFESNEAEVLECKLSGSLKLTGKVEIYMQTMIDKARDEMLAQSNTAIADYKKTGGKSAGLPWLFAHELAVQHRHHAWTRDVELAFRQM
jgi:dynein heavy chain